MYCEFTEIYSVEASIVSVMIPNKVSQTISVKTLPELQRAP